MLQDLSNFRSRFIQPYQQTEKGQRGELEATFFLDNLYGG
jgi:hypothetical protein